MPERWFSGPRTMASCGGVADGLLARGGISGSTIEGDGLFSERIGAGSVVPGTCEEGVRCAQHPAASDLDG